jgi:hypothetical protein
MERRILRDGLGLRSNALLFRSCTHSLPFPQAKFDITSVHGNLDGLTELRTPDHAPNP